MREKWGWPRRNAELAGLHRLYPRFKDRVEDLVETFVRDLKLSAPFSISLVDFGRGRKALCAGVRYAGGNAPGGKTFRVAIQFDNPAHYVVFTGALSELSAQDCCDVFARIECLDRAADLDLGEIRRDLSKARDPSVPPTRKSNGFVFPVRNANAASALPSRTSEIKRLETPKPQVVRLQEKEANLSLYNGTTFPLALKWKIPESERARLSNMERVVVLMYALGASHIRGELAQALVRQFPAVFRNRDAGTSTISNVIQLKGWVVPGAPGIVSLSESGIAHALKFVQR